MKGKSLALAALLLLPASAVAQPSAPLGHVARPDVAGSIGWLNVNINDLDRYNDWSNRGVHGALTFGWYWSEHLKTELEASASTRTDFYAATEEVTGGVRTTTVSEFGFSTRRLTLGQQYQFLENAWFHPHLAAGVDFNWQRINRFDREVYSYNLSSRQSTFIRPSNPHADRTELHVRPYAAAGFKAYMTSRAFIRSDMRLVVDRRIEEVLLRFGVGVDF